MNKDLDERLVPNGQYRDASNVQVSTSEGSDVGSVENILGNALKNAEASGEWADNFGLTNAKCIGATKDPQNEKIYWFLTSDEAKLINETFETMILWSKFSEKFKKDLDRKITSFTISDDIM